MTIWEAIVLGIVQGLTEFLPVSSSGHLAIFEHLLGVNMDGGMLFDVMLHLGTLTAIVLVFYKDIGKLIIEGFRMIRDVFGNARTFFQNQKNAEETRYSKIVHNNYRKFVLMIIVASVPTAIIGFLLRNLVTVTSATLLFPGLGLFITGILLLVVDFVEPGKKIPKDTSLWSALVIGACQGVAVLPGISRSGMTITAALLSGYNRKFAVKFSFIMSIPAILGAGILELKEAVGASNVTGSFLLCSFIGAIVAGIVGYFCIKFMLRLVQKKKLRYFSYYCFVIGMVAIVANFLL